MYFNAFRENNILAKNMNLQDLIRYFNINLYYAIYFLLFFLLKWISKIVWLIFFKDIADAK